MQYSSRSDIVKYSPGIFISKSSLRSSVLRTLKKSYTPWGILILELGGYRSGIIGLHVSWSCKTIFFPPGLFLFFCLSPFLLLDGEVVSYWWTHGYLHPSLCTCIIHLFGVPFGQFRWHGREQRTTTGFCLFLVLLVEMLFEVSPDDLHVLSRLKPRRFFFFFFDSVTS